LDSDCAIAEIQPLTSLAIKIIKGHFTGIVSAVVFTEFNQMV
jgi:hypothetical protein